MNNPTKTLTIFTLAMLIAGAIDSIRNLPTTALFGSSLVFFACFSAVVFLVPTALVSGELASAWTEKGGVYAWVEMAFGEKWAVLAIWLQWVNTIVWYPTILSFIAGTAAFVISPQLATNKLYLVSVILVVFWGMTLINLRGIKMSAQFATACALLGMIIPVVLIFAMGIGWLWMGKPLQIHLTAASLIPDLTHTQNWISLTALMTAYLGLELATVHVGSVKNPRRTFPAALFLAAAIIVLTMLFGSLIIAMVLPHDQINLVAGVMQAFRRFFEAYHIVWVLPFMAVMIVLGSLGEMVNWIISPAKGMMQAAKAGYLPKWFAKESETGVAVNVLIAQAVLVSFVCLAFLLMPSVNGSYWLLTDLSTQLYMLMYFLMFMAALYLKFKASELRQSFIIPGGKVGMTLVCLLGLFGTVVTLIVGFFPPGSIDVGGTFHYVSLFSLGLIVMLLPVLLLYRYHAK